MLLQSTEKGFAGSQKNLKMVKNMDGKMLQKFDIWLILADL